MLFLFPYQLKEHLQESLYPCYLLLGKDQILLQESQEYICAKAQSMHFSKHYSFNLDANTDWDAIFRIYISHNLFESNKTILLKLHDKVKNAEISKNLSKLSLLMQQNKNILLILRSSNKLTSNDEKSILLKNLSNNAVMVNCSTPEQIQMQRWLIERSKYMKLSIDKTTCKLLCYCYDGNLIALSQTLKKLSLIYTDGNLTLQRVKAVVINNTEDYLNFTPFHWMDAALLGKSKRAIYILQQLRLVDSQPVILLRSSQSTILLLINIKYKMIKGIHINKLFDKYKVWYKRRIILKNALNRINIIQLKQAVLLMTKIELLLKQEHNFHVWSYLSALSLLLCGKSFPATILNDCYQFFSA